MVRRVETTYRAQTAKQIRRGAIEKAAAPRAMKGRPMTRMPRERPLLEKHSQLLIRLACKHLGAHKMATSAGTSPRRNTANPMQAQRASLLPPALLIAAFLWAVKLLCNDISTTSLASLKSRGLPL